MSPSYTEVEDKLARSYRALVDDIPDQPPVPWSNFSTTPGAIGRHRQRIVGIAASVVLIVLATVLWSAPSAGARYHGAEVVRVRCPEVAQLHRTHLGPCVSAL